MGVAALRETGQRREDACLCHPHVIASSFTRLFRGDEVRIVRKRHLYRRFRRSRKAGERRRRLQIIRRRADQGDIILSAGDQVRLRRLQVGSGQREPRLGLGNVRPRKIADFKSVVRCLQVDAKRADIRQIQRHDRAITDHIHIGRDNLGEDRCLGPAQIGLTRLHATLAAFTRCGLRHPDK